jgi:polysaccharide export outer membrane protein
MARSSLPALTLALSRCLPIVLLSSQAITVLAQTPRQGANGSGLDQPAHQPANPLDRNPDPSAAESTAEVVFPDIPRSGPDRPQIRSIQAAPQPNRSPATPTTPAQPAPGPALAQPSDPNAAPVPPLQPGQPIPDWPESLTAPPPEWRVYRLSSYDTIAVQVQGFPELNTSTIVNVQGQISVPLLGIVNAEGLTTAELQKFLQQGYERYLVNPIVTVGVLTPVNPDIVVTGEVVKPGFYRVSPFDTVVTALVASGGATDWADLRAIKVRRQLPDGSTIEKNVNLLSLLVEGAPEPRIYLQDGDAIVVPRRESGIDPGYDADLMARSNVARAAIRIRMVNYAGRGGLVTLTLPNGSTFIDALNGVSLDTARLRRIALIRFDPEQGKPVTRILDGKAAFMGDPANNPPLRDNDVVVVNRNLIARVTYALNTVTQPFRDVLGFLLFFQQLDEAATSLFGPGGTFGGTAETEEEGSSSNNNN